MRGHRGGPTDLPPDVAGDTRAGGRAHVDGPTRQLMNAYPERPAGFPVGWLDTWLERWDLIIGAVRQ
jgi:hypothetical protein